MTHVRLYKFKLQSGKEKIWFDWCQELKRRRKEVMASLKKEKVLSESCFLSEDGKHVYYFMEAEDIEFAKKVSQSNTFKIDSEHRSKRKESLKKIAELKELFYFENR